MDYADKLPPSPWYIFAPPRRYIFPPPLTLWEHLGYSDLSFDFIVTNQLVASAQYFGFEPSAVIRGGMMMDNFEISRSSRFRHFSMVSTFGFINDLGDLNDLGPDPAFDLSNAVRYTALILAQKIGLMLPRYGYTWTNPSCIMFRALPGKMRAHLDSLDAEKCREGTEPVMTRGFAASWYSRQLLRGVGGSIRK